MALHPAVSRRDALLQHGMGKSIISGSMPFYKRFYSRGLIEQLAWPPNLSGGSASFQPSDGATKFVRANRRTFLCGRSRRAGQAIKPSVG
jgi:hypothetical protein